MPFVYEPGDVGLSDSQEIKIAFRRDLFLRRRKNPAIVITGDLKLVGGKEQQTRQTQKRNDKDPESIESSLKHFQRKKRELHKNWELKRAIGRTAPAAHVSAFDGDGKQATSFLPSFSSDALFQRFCRRWPPR
jgi:hypothetical protein